MFPDEWGLPGLSHFMLTAQAPGAQVEPLRLTIHDDCGRMNIWNPAPVGMTLGMAHIMTELG